MINTPVWCSHLRICPKYQKKVTKTWSRAKSWRVHALDKKLSEILNSGEEEHQFEVAWWQMNDISDLGVIHKIGNFDPRLQKNHHFWYVNYHCHFILLSNYHSLHFLCIITTVFSLVNWTIFVVVNYGSHCIFIPARINWKNFSWISPGFVPCGSL